MTDIKLRTNLRAFRAAMEAADGARRKAGETAARVEAYRLMGVLKRDLQRNAYSLAPLTYLWRGTRSSKKPLAALAKVVRYGARRKGDVLEVSVGWIDYRLSASWLKIARRLTGGSTSPVTGKRRRYFARRGAEYGPRIRRYFFLRQTTSRFTTPARPVIEPFWQRYRAEAERNIASNFAKKMAGMRI